MRVKKTKKATTKTKPKLQPRGWTCPECGRRFGRANQSHGCAPAMTADAYFAERPDNDRRIYEAVMACLEKLGDDVTADFVHVGVLFKRTRTFAELRPKREGMSLAFLLSRVVEDDRIVKVLKTSAHRAAHVVDVTGPRDVDRVVRGWLAEAFASSTV